MLKQTLRLIAKSQKENIDNFKPGILREKLKSIDLDSTHALVISGIRRCGKSTLLRQISKRLNKYYYFNFDDPRAVDFELNDFEKLKKACNEEYGASDYYLFDEIQAISKWEIAVRLLLDQKKKVILTGSNASLLSKELGSKLTGRHLRYELYPFSYREFLKFKKKKNSTDSLTEYLTDGGFPEYLEKKNTEILHELLNDIVERDIAVRHGIRNTRTLKELAIYLLTNVGKEFSYNKLKVIFSMGSPNTAIDFVSYLEDSHLISTIRLFDYSLKKQQVNPKKVYSVDNGMSNANSVHFSEDNGRMLENSVFAHLRRKFSEIFYFRDKHECDFLIKEKDKITHALQVCYNITEENKSREIEGLLEAMKKFGLNKGLIVTFDQEDEINQDEKQIRLIPAWKWMSE
jgi:hypothetical protein